ncbi:endolytic transglycosylase MltG [Cognatilysobacter bugurensis]|uniref:Endolytic murein transglycosylase n=1 Tax=Cognatilysobacter bugurensis TaxID=543356 RepID=A0A918SU40_9GAMM|nr:endolytic transglycosylase MltG [Lysobacter bugurensis]GHA69906.1 aminodeoxychorismate lyase [Lysobacter bugurensis]
MTRKRASFGGLVLLLLIALGIAGVWAWQRYTGFADAPLAGIEEGETLVIERGDALTSVLRKLREVGVENGQAFEWSALAKQLGAADRLQVGEYRLEPGMTPRELLTQMREGRVVQRRVTIVEGWNIRELRAALARAEPLEQEAAKMSDAELMKALGHAGQHPEGRFLPETYLYTTGDSDLDVLGRAHAAMEKALAEAWARRRPDSVLKSPEEMLTLASIVEKETGVAEERPRIAGLFERRLRIGMRLQTDPTVIYGIGASYDGNIRKRDLQTDTPYNTYTRAGLPPTPIAMPGVDALNAVAQPADGDALYFVAVGDGSGRHLFAKSLAEHEANVAQYLRNYRAARKAAQ